MRPRRAPRPRLPLFTGEVISAEDIPEPKESEFQIQLADFLNRWIAPGWEYTHMPTGEKRDMGTAAKLKAMGTKAGWPDLIFVSPKGVFHGLELKRKGGDLSEEQEAFHSRATGKGWHVAVAYNFDAAVKILTLWGALRINIVGGLK